MNHTIRKKGGNKNLKKSQRWKKTNSSGTESTGSTGGPTCGPETLSRVSPSSGAGSGRVLQAGSLLLTEETLRVGDPGSNLTS